MSMLRNRFLPFSLRYRANGRQNKSLTRYSDGKIRLIPFLGRRCNILFMFVDIMNYDLVNYIKHFIFQNKAELRGSLLFINKPKKRGFFSPNREAEVYALLYVRPSMHNAHVYACSFNAEMYALRYLYSMLKAKMCALLYARPLAAYLDAQSGNVWYTI